MPENFIFVLIEKLWLVENNDEGREKKRIGKKIEGTYDHMNASI